ncbi:acetone carboxylase subunit gamma [Saccharopolyspora shandongensis]|uniref:acetone carboxylase subunit gamma n=1 Tax=Saccharopolyspora shandongensis TaxID=418495 RepID=UPI0033D7BB26
MEIREFICPGCTTLLEVEAATPGFSIVFDFLPDLETFYSDWLNRPLPEQR